MYGKAVSLEKDCVSASVCVVYVGVVSRWTVEWNAMCGKQDSSVWRCMEWGVQ